MPPMPRSSPYWYRRYYHPITTIFAESFRHTEDGIHVLPAFAKPEYEVDGIHLTEESGPRWIVHLSNILDISLFLIEHSSCIILTIV
jgi:hypothetical protein